MPIRPSRRLQAAEQRKSGKFMMASLYACNGPRATILAFVLGIFLVSAGSEAATLYEQSLVKLNQRLVQADPDNFTFVFLGDSRDNEQVFRKIMALTRSTKPLFVLHGGDLERSGCPKDIDHFLRVLREEAPELPLFVVPGNHERCLPDRARDEGKGYFLQTIGPLDYTLDLPRIKTKIVVLDNMDYALTAQQLQYLRQELTPGKALNFVAMHIPPQTKRWGKDHTFVKGAAELLTILQERRVPGALFSHMHLFDEDRLGDTRMFISGGGGAPLHTRFNFGRAAFHMLVVKVKDGVASIQPVWLQP